MSDPILGTRITIRARGPDLGKAIDAALRHMKPVPACVQLEMREPERPGVWGFTMPYGPLMQTHDGKAYHRERIDYLDGLDPIVYPRPLMPTSYRKRVETVRARNARLLREAMAEVNRIAPE